MGDVIYCRSPTGVFLEKSPKSYFGKVPKIPRADPADPLCDAQQAAYK